MLLLLVAVAGCGSKAAATPGPSPRPTHVKPSATIVAAVPTVAPEVTSPPTVPPSVAPSPSAVPSATAAPTVATVPPAPRPGKLLAAAVEPASAEPDATLNASVSTSGSVDRVDLYLSGAPGGAGPKVISLTSSGRGQWAGTVTAPSRPGTYHYTVGLYSGGRRAILDNDAWNVTVVGASPSPTVATPALAFPGDVPLVPPFSYSNPVAASFSAEGRVVSGIEITSNSRPDVSPSAVAQFYETRFPRAGWTVDQSTVPAAGASSFSIVATQAGSSQTRVAVVQFAAGSVEVFYGTYA